MSTPQQITIIRDYIERLEQATRDIPRVQRAELLHFTKAPNKPTWGGSQAIFRDVDGNTFVQVQTEHRS